jgi:hypothetical protein
MHPYRSSNRALSTLFASVLAVTAISNASAQATDPVFPAMSLSQGSRGAGIIAGLGNRLPEVAKFYGMTDQDFGKLAGGQDRSPAVCL